MKQKRTTRVLPPFREGAELVVKANPGLDAKRGDSELGVYWGIPLLGNREGFRWLSEYFAWRADRIDEGRPFYKGDAGDHDHLACYAPLNLKLSDDFDVQFGSFSNKLCRRVLKACKADRQHRASGPTPAAGGCEPPTKRAPASGQRGGISSFRSDEGRPLGPLQHGNLQDQESWFMCFALYLGTQLPAPVIPCSAERPIFHTEACSGEWLPHREKFSLPCITVIGSDQGCGCGFRHLRREGDGWADVDLLVSLPDYSTARTQPNHEHLADLLARQLREEPFVELFGNWEGYSGCLENPILWREEITLARIVHPHFHFRIQGFYRVVASEVMPLNGATKRQ